VGQGRPAEAVDVLSRASDRDADGAGLLLGMRAWAMASAGRREEALRLLDDLRERATYRYVARYAIAWTLGTLGDTATALDEFERSVEERDMYLAYPLFPGFDPIRTEPRFHRGLERLGLEWAIGR
jgi:tetratricopeptide (TPR) repeat protein